MAQRLITNLNSISTEDFIAKTAILAELVVEHEATKQKEEELIIIDECHVVRDGPEQKEGSSASEESEELQQAAKYVGAELRGIAARNQRELETTRISALFRNFGFHSFSTACSNLLRSTVHRVTNQWDQTLLVFANYMQLREALRGNTSQQNEMALYIGRYFANMGFQSWISWIQRQDDWQHVGLICPGAHDPPICPPEASSDS